MQTFTRVTLNIKNMYYSTIATYLITKVRPPIEFLNLGVANPLITQMLLRACF